MRHDHMSRLKWRGTFFHGMQSFNYKQPTEPCYWPWKIGATSAQQPRLYIYIILYIYIHTFSGLISKAMSRKKQLCKLSISTTLELLITKMDPVNVQSVSRNTTCQKNFHDQPEGWVSTQLVDPLRFPCWFPFMTGWLSGWWFQPLGKIWKSVGVTIPNIWRNKKKTKHQPALMMWVSYCYIMI